MWEYPGGRVEPGETLEQAIQREIREEFDADSIVYGLLDTIITESAGQRWAVNFMSVDIKGEITIKCHDATEWVSWDRLSRRQHLPSGQEFNRRLQLYHGLLK